MHCISFVRKSTLKLPQRYILCLETLFVILDKTLCKIFKNDSKSPLGNLYIDKIMDLASRNSMPAN